MPYCQTTGKEMFATQGKAYQAAHNIDRRIHAARPYMRVYRCNHCGQYHITHEDSDGFLIVNNRKVRMWPYNRRDYKPREKH